jgi:hypothetical protein
MMLFSPSFVLSYERTLIFFILFKNFFNFSSYLRSCFLRGVRACLASSCLTYLKSPIRIC